MCYTKVRYDTICKDRLNWIYWWWLWKHTMSCFREMFMPVQFYMSFEILDRKSLFNELMDLPTGQALLFPKLSFQPLRSRSSQSAVCLLLLVGVIQMLPSAPLRVCTFFNEQRKQPAHKWGLEDPLLHIKDTINWGQISQCVRVLVYCWGAWGSLPQILA